MLKYVPEDPCDPEDKGDCAECKYPPPEYSDRCIAVCNSGLQCMRRAVQRQQMCRQHLGTPEIEEEAEVHMRPDIQTQQSDGKRELDLPTRKLKRLEVSPLERKKKFDKICTEFGKHVEIQKSSIAKARFGAFTKIPIKRGEIIGYYAGRSQAKASLDGGYRPRYLMSGIDAFDADGILVTDDGRDLTGLQLDRLSLAKMLETHGQWRGSCERFNGRLVDNSNWTRFIGRATNGFANVYVSLKGKQFGYSIFFYTKHDVPAGAELFLEFDEEGGSKPVNPASVGTRYSGFERGEAKFIVDKRLLVDLDPVLIDIDPCDPEEVARDCGQCDTRDPNEGGKQCSARCASGAQCKRNAVFGKDTCRQHVPKQ